MTKKEAAQVLASLSVDPDILNWVPNGSSCTRWELIESGELTLDQVVEAEIGEARDQLLGNGTS